MCDIKQHIVPAEDIGNRVTNYSSPLKIRSIAYHL
jgi:hypothetical protein